MIHLSRLKSARVMRGLSLRELADLTDGTISLPALSRYERGDGVPEPEKLRLIARALGLSVNYFLREPKEIGPVEFRKRKSLSKKLEEQIREQTRDFLERYTEAEFLLNEEVAKFPTSKGVIGKLVEAESAAEELRAIWKLGDSPIHSVVEELEAKHIRVFALEADRKFDGLSSVPAGREDFIVYNSHQPIDRQRFTLLHELGHHFLTIAPGVDEEKLVNRFAGAFAVTATALRQSLGNNRKNIHPVELLGLKKEFGLSVAALLYRAKDLAIISDYTHRNAMIVISKMGWRKDEPQTFIGEEKPTRLLELLGRGIAEECFTTSKAAELYGMKLGEFREVLLRGA
ncbi:MAG: XRE family transcriptional regulator [Saprospiraceae bacterium]